MYFSTKNLPYLLGLLFVLPLLQEESPSPPVVYVLLFCSIFVVALVAFVLSEYIKRNKR